MSDKVEKSSEKRIEDGIYKFNFDGATLGLFHVEDGKIQFDNEAFGVKKGTDKARVDVTYGELDFSDKRGLANTANDKYSILMNVVFLDNFKLYANFIPNEKSLRLHTGELMEYMDEEAIKKMEDDYEKTDKYEHFYTLQPENQGKVVVITGAAGYGKSTSAEILRKDHGFVLYEGDCFVFGYNPYPKMSPKGPSYWETKHVKHVSAERNIARDDLVKAFQEGHNTDSAEQPPTEKRIKIYSMMCDDILKEKAKIGGNWVIPSAIYQREARDHIREKLGNQCIFIMLKIDEDLQFKRLAKRTAGTAGGEISEEAFESLKAEMKSKNFAKGFEHFQKGEKNTIELVVDESMTPDIVVDIILEKIKSF